MIDQIWLAVRDTEYDVPIYRAFYDKQEASRQILVWYAEEYIDLLTDRAACEADGDTEGVTDMNGFATELFENSEVVRDMEEDGLVVSIHTDTDVYTIMPIEIN